LRSPPQRRIQAEDIIINIGKEASVPQPPPGHNWKAVIHNQYVSWLAGWKDSINTKDWKCVLCMHACMGDARACEAVTALTCVLADTCSWVRQAPSRARATSASMKRSAQ
jgi:hypothetical protein